MATTTNEEVQAEVYSLKLINGEHVLAELNTPEDVDEEEFVEMVNPILVKFMPTADGNHVTVGTEYDPCTDMSRVLIPYANLLSEPQLVSNFFREFYAKSLVFAYIKRVRMELTSKRDGLSPTDLDASIKNANLHIQQYISQVSERYDVNIPVQETELDSIKPNGVTLH